MNRQGTSASPDDAGRGAKNAKKSKSGGSENAATKSVLRDAAKNAREAKEPKAAKPSGDDRNNELQRLAADVAGLRDEIKGLHATLKPAVQTQVTTPPLAPQTGDRKKGKTVAGATTTFADDAFPVSAKASAELFLGDQAAGALAERHDAAVLYGWAFRAHGDKQQSGARAVFGLAPLLARSDDDRAARVAYALASVPKVALARLLLTHGALPAARLGEEAKLTTGSLYHHLREMAHAGVVGNAGRSLYALTPTGQQAVLLLLALSTDETRDTR